MGLYHSTREETRNEKSIDIGVSYKIGVQKMTESRESEKWKKLISVRRYLILYFLYTE
jgi:hypothetical protein